MIKIDENVLLHTDNNHTVMMVHELKARQRDKKKLLLSLFAFLLPLVHWRVNPITVHLNSLSFSLSNEPSLNSQCRRSVTYHQLFFGGHLLHYPAEVLTSLSTLLELFVAQRTIIVHLI